MGDEDNIVINDYRVFFGGVNKFGKSYNCCRIYVYLICMKIMNLRYIYLSMILKMLVIKSY